MSKVFRIKKGLDINLLGEAKHEIAEFKNPVLYAIKPPDFHGVVPKLKVKPGFEVKAGSPLFYNKYQPEVMFTSPVSGKVSLVNRGERRRILEIVVESDGKDEAIEFQTGEISNLQAEDIKKLLLESGVWPFIRQRPYGIIADAKDTPKAIFISGFDSAPLAPDYEFILKDSVKEFQAGIDALSKLTSGKVHLGLASGGNSVLSGIKNVEISQFSGPHPAGNVGIQIHHVSPINKGEIYWYINPQDLVIVGRLLLSGKLDMSRTVAITGSEYKNPVYCKTKLGANLEGYLSGNLNSDNVRVISGNVLTGTKVAQNGYLGFYDSHLSIIPEGNYHDFLGWAMPGLDKFSISKTYFSWLNKNKKYSLDTNMNGGHRAFVMSGEYEKVLPMDILPVQLLKSILVEDIDKMEQLGIYEVIEEDLALCEFVCTSKIEVQEILRNGINTMIKELS